jgi:hypothetical protein
MSRTCRPVRQLEPMSMPKWLKHLWMFSVGQAHVMRSRRRLRNLRLTLPNEYLDQTGAFLFVLLTKGQRSGRRMMKGRGCFGLRRLWEPAFPLALYSATGEHLSNLQCGRVGRPRTNISGSQTERNACTVLTCCAILIGNARVSSNDQEAVTQVAALKTAGSERIYREKAPAADGTGLNSTGSSISSAKGTCSWYGNSTDCLAPSAP